MKIISLTMNAFLAYKEKTTINFEDMIDHGLYLISGPTGAGKTTIFDAITFALYGVASGSERNQSYFRSDYALDKDETYVELIFELHQHIYTIKRSPSYTRVGYKTAKLANAYLSYDHQTIEGVKEVNAKINQLLGVDIHQFKQIVMIAQGEFTKLIYASSEEREKVLRHIFHSESLVSFENLLREETKRYKDQYALSSQQLLSRYQLLSLSDDFMRQHKDGFHVSYIEEAHIENQKVYTDLLQAQEKYTIIQKQYDEFSQAYFQKQKQNEDILNYQKTNQAYQSLLSQEMVMNEFKQDIDKLKIIEKNQSMIHQYQSMNQELLKVKEDYAFVIEKQTLINKEFVAVEKDYQNIPQLNLKKEQLLVHIDQMKQAVEKQKTYQEISKKEQTTKIQLDKLKTVYQKLNDDYALLVKRMERDQDNIEQLPQLQLELQKNEQLVNEMNQRRISIHELSDLFDNYTHILDDHYGYTERYKAASQKYLEMNEKYHQEDENFKCQQAGILAKTLEDNKPCPVCGSIQHPTPAHISQRVLTSQELEQLSHDVEKQKEVKEDTYQQVLLQNQRVQDIKTQITLLKRQLNIQEDLTKEVFIRLLADMTHVTQNQEKTYQKKHTEVEYLKKIKNSLVHDQVRLTKMMQQLDESQKQYHELEMLYVTYQTQLSELQQHESFVLADSLKQQLYEETQKLDTLNKKIQQIDSGYHQCLKTLSVLKNQIETYQTRENELSVAYTHYQKQYHDFIVKTFQDENEYLKYASLLSQLNEKEKTYQEYMIQLGTLSSRLDELKKHVAKAEFVDLSVEEAKLIEMNKQKELSFQQMNQYSHIYEQNQSLLKTLEKEYKKNQDVFDAYTMYQDLSDMTSGKNAQRLSFERYVLSSYFEHILEYANIELLKMSNGRYALYRKQETKGAKQQGLDLSVLDYETGMMRDIQSLSGGESFKAALSLALGLSSMIQSYAGGIELNTLFIDEGFGSLDSESIDQALNVLLDLKNDNKVIGIISHVNELKERITTQIVVDKTKNGSYLHIEKE